MNRAVADSISSSFSEVEVTGHITTSHTRGGGEVQVAENLRVVTGPAEYGQPEVQQIVEAH